MLSILRPSPSGHKQPDMRERRPRLAVTALSTVLVSDRNRSLEDVLYLLAGLLGVPGDLVLVPLSFQVVVVGRLAGGLLALSRQLLSLVLHLVHGAHEGL